MPQTIDVYFLPALTTPEQLAGKTVVVIDVLRATTTIVQALASGAREVIPCLEVADARALAKKCDGSKALGGERGGKRIEGFDFGNSPAEYTRESVQGKSVFFTTTNGTRAMMACRQARRVLPGAFTNLSVVTQALASEEEIAILCSGTGGEITREDVLLAGAIVDKLSLRDVSRNDQADIALDAWRGCVKSGVPLEELLLASHGGRNLSSIGQGTDVALAAQIDKHRIVPELLLDEWKIVLVNTTTER